MEVIASDVQHLYLSIAGSDAFFEGSRVKGAFDFQSGLCRGGGDQLDDGETIRQWAATPVLSPGFSTTPPRLRAAHPSNDNGPGRKRGR